MNSGETTRVFHLGSHLCREPDGGTAYRTGGTSGFVERLLGQLGIEPVHSDELLVRWRTAGQRQALIITNPTSGEVTESLDIGEHVNVVDSLGGRIESRGNLLTIRVAPLDVRLIALMGARTFERIFDHDVISKRERAELTLGHREVDRVALHEQLGYNPRVIERYAGGYQHQYRRGWVHIQT